MVSFPKRLPMNKDRDYVCTQWHDLTLGIFSLSKVELRQ